MRFLQSLLRRRKNIPEPDTLLPLLKVRTPIYHENLPFILCWSQKSGCTAALKWYLHHAGLLPDALAFAEKSRRLRVHSYENKVLKARPGYSSDLVAAIRKGVPLVSFLRCPYERVFSSYMILNNGRFLKMEKKGVISPGIALRRRVLDFVYGGGDDLNRPVSFRNYLQWLGEQDLEALDPHHTPQCTALYRLVGIEHYRLADFEPAITRLEQRYSLEPSRSVRAQFTSGHHRQKIEVSVPRVISFLEQALPLDRFPLDELPSVNRALLEQSGFESLIHKIFAEDIAAYDRIDPIVAPGQ